MSVISEGTEQKSEKDLGGEDIVTRECCLLNYQLPVVCRDGGASRRVDMIKNLKQDNQVLSHKLREFQNVNNFSRFGKQKTASKSVFGSRLNVQVKCLRFTVKFKHLKMKVCLALKSNYNEKASFSRSCHWNEHVPIY